MDAPVLRAPEDDYDSVVILFPSADAVDLAKMPEDELKKIKRVYLIDCTWNQTAHFLKQDNIQMIKKVKIQTEKTAFWRY